MKAEAEHAKVILDRLQEQQKEVFKQWAILKERVLDCLVEQKIMTKNKVETFRNKDRIDFKFLGVDFFVTHRWVFDSTDDDPTLTLSIEYGVTRRQGEDHKKDKALRSYSVNGTGLISNPGSLEGSWMVNTKDAKKNVKLGEIHYRMFRDMFSDALDWFNSYPVMDRK